MGQTVNPAMDDDHRRAGEAIRAALRPGERLLTHSPLLRSPGLEEPPPTTADALNTFNPFAGFSRAAREKGTGWAVFATALGVPQEDYSPSELMAKDKVARRFGHIFCGVADSEAGRLFAALKRHVSVDYGDRPAWVARTDQRLLVFTDPNPGPGFQHSGKPLRDLVRLGLRAGRYLVKTVRDPLAAPEHNRFSGSVLAIYECPPGVVAAVPAPPVENKPRVMLWFADQSWLVVSFGDGPPAERMSAALQPGDDRPPGTAAG
jgi:hypothetical protein